MFSTKKTGTPNVTLMKHAYIYTYYTSMHINLILYQLYHENGGIKIDKRKETYIFVYIF